MCGLYLPILPAWQFFQGFTHAMHVMTNVSASSEMGMEMLKTAVSPIALYSIKDDAS